MWRQTQAYACVHGISVCPCVSGVFKPNTALQGRRRATLSTRAASGLCARICNEKTGKNGEKSKENKKTWAWTSENKQTKHNSVFCVCTILSIRSARSDMTPSSSRSPLPDCSLWRNTQATSVGKYWTHTQQINKHNKQNRNEQANRKKIKAYCTLSASL